MSSVSIESGGITWARVGLSRTWSRLGLASVFITVASLHAATSFVDGSAATIGSVFAVFGVAWMLAFFAFIVSFAIWLTRTPKPGAVRVDDATLQVRRDDRWTSVERSKVKSAYLVRRPVGGGEVATVEIVLADGDVVTVRTSGEAEANALVSELGFAPGGAAVEIALTTPGRRLLHLLLGLGAYYASSIASVPLALAGGESGRLPWWGGFVVAPVMLGLYALFKRLARPPVVTIGGDGLVLVSGRKTRYVPRASVQGVQHDNVRFIPFVHTRDGVLTLGGIGVDVPRAGAAARLVYDRLVARTGAPAERGLLFDRGGRSVTEWREAIRRSLEDGSYRAAGASVDDAAAVLRSATATPEQRVGAALALRVAGQPEPIRVAAQGMADDRVRVALEAAADQPDEIVEKALARVPR